LAQPRGFYAFQICAQAKNIYYPRAHAKKKKEFQEVFGFLLWMKLDGNPSHPAHNIPTPQTRLGRLQLIISNFDSSNVTFQRGVQCFIVLLRDHIQTDKERAT
jgi:hypothetical protein